MFARLLALVVLITLVPLSAYAEQAPQSVVGDDALKGETNVQLVRLPQQQSPATRPASVAPTVTAVPFPNSLTGGLVLIGLLSLRRVWTRRHH